LSPSREAIQAGRSRPEQHDDGRRAGGQLEVRVADDGGGRGGGQVHQMVDQRGEAAAAQRPQGDEQLEGVEPAARLQRLGHEIRETGLDVLLAVQVVDVQVQHVERGWVANKEGGAADRLEEALVKVGGDRVRAIEGRHDVAVAVAVGESEGGAECGVGVQPQAVLVGEVVEGVDGAEVRGARGGDDRDRLPSGGDQLVDRPRQRFAL
jgi:hypothetical protein